MDEEVKYAGFWLRVAAFLLDWIVIFSTLFILQTFIRGNVIAPPDFSGLIETPEDFTKIFTSAIEVLKPLVISNAIFFLAVILYWIILTWRFGATLGKMAAGIKVVREDLRPISFGTVLVREFLVKKILYLILFFISWLGYLWVSWDKKKQGWHDKIARTVVIKEEKAVLPVEPVKPAKPGNPAEEEVKPPAIQINVR